MERLPGQPLHNYLDDGDAFFRRRMHLDSAEEETLFQETIQASMQHRSHDRDLEEAIAASMRPTEDDIAFAEAVAASLNTTENFKPWDISQESACGPE